MDALNMDFGCWCYSPVTDQGTLEKWFYTLEQGSDGPENLLQDKELRLSGSSVLSRPKERERMKFIKLTETYEE